MGQVKFGAIIQDGEYNDIINITKTNINICIIQIVNGSND